jgi:hypothetical protein
MAVFPGTPADAVAEETYRFMIGLAGAGLAVLGVAAIVVGLGAR